MPETTLACRGAVLCALLLGAPALAQQAELSLQPCSLELHAAWEPLTDTTYGSEKKHAVLRDLAPAVARATHDETSFRALLPPAPVAVGDTWLVDAASLLPLLRQLHSGARVTLHHGAGIGAPGAWACLRALDPDHAEIAVRVHAEFLLAGDGERVGSSWFTPAQFRGRLVIDRRSGRAVGLRLAVPPSRANVDVNVAVGRSVMATSAACRASSSPAARSPRSPPAQPA
jgi:hypothetical protein